MLSPSSRELPRPTFTADGYNLTDTPQNRRCSLTVGLLTPNMHVEGHIGGVDPCEHDSSPTEVSESENPSSQAVPALAAKSHLWKNISIILEILITKEGCEAVPAHIGEMRPEHARLVFAMTSASCVYGQHHFRYKLQGR